MEIAFLSEEVLEEMKLGSSLFTCFKVLGNFEASFEF